MPWMVYTLIFVIVNISLAMIIAAALISSFIFCVYGVLIIVEVITQVCK